VIMRIRPLYVRKVTSSLSFREYCSKAWPFGAFPVANETYDVFVSYSRADWRHAAEIDSVLPGNGLRSFFDRCNLAPGIPWVRALEQAIGAAKAVIVLIGPRGLRNTQQYEHELALVRQSRDSACPIEGRFLRKASVAGPKLADPGGRPNF
jgi:hypothetical protein